MLRPEVKECQKTISEYLSKSGFSEVPNGNTPSPLSPTNSVGSQVIELFPPDFFQPIPLPSTRLK